MGEPDEVDTVAAPPGRSSGLTLLLLLAGAVAAAMLLGQLTNPARSPRPPVALATITGSDVHPGPVRPKPIGAESLKWCPQPLGGLTLADHARVKGLAVERWDCDVLTQGPWSIVIRAAGGHFGAQSAVVTYPTENRGFGVPSSKPAGSVWNPGSQTLLFPIGQSHAQIVGDLGLATLQNLAVRVTIANGKPQISSLRDFAASATTTVSPADIHEMSYQSADLGQEGRLGPGQIWTAVMTGAGVEAAAFADRARPAGSVRDKPAIYSTNPYPPRYAFAFGTSTGFLAWESTPGIVTCIGYEGFAGQTEAIKALRALADEGTVLTPTEWLNKDRAGPLTSQVQNRPRSGDRPRSG
jgi:hypothetical protein